MIVITGATGNVGTPLVRALVAAGERVTAVSRGVSRIPELPAGARHTTADLTRAESLRPACEGADALFLHDTGAGARQVDPAAVLDVAKAGGVRRVVLLSSQGVVTRPHSASHGGTGRSMEETVRDSGMEWTILRPGGFASNAFAWAESVRAHRVAAAPFADVGLPVVDPLDIAEVAAAALRGDDGHEGAIHELTGPALSTPKERAAAIAEALGEPVRFVEQTPEEAGAQMRSFMPDDVVETTLAILGRPTPAELRVSPDVARLLGRPPHPFSAWAARNVEAFR